MNEANSSVASPNHGVNIGDVFGRWTVVRQSEKRSSSNGFQFECRCQCGTLRTISPWHLRKGKTHSCGCLCIEKKTKHGCGRTYHQTREYRIWAGMRSRCNNPKHHAYARYGGRGISVCEEWVEFPVFFLEMGPAPESGTIDRIDNNGPYCKENCRWSTSKVQARNRENTKYISINGVSLPLTEWAEKTGLGISTIRERLRRGWPEEMALLPVKKTNLRKLQ